jgi:hypothetical protein
MIDTIAEPLPMERPKKVTAPIKTFIEVRRFQHLPLRGFAKAERDSNSVFRISKAEPAGPATRRDATRLEDSQKNPARSQE